jgi:hypothetical protein
VILFLYLSGCASYSGYGLEPGTSTADDVRRTMGEPAIICPLPGGGENWVYPRGPVGLDIFNARIDGGGVLVGIENVLSDAGFSRVVPGRSKKDDVRCLFGPAFRESYFKARDELVWEYRFEDAWGYSATHHVLFDNAGVVTGTLRIRDDRGRGHGR